MVCKNRWLILPLMTSNSAKIYRNHFYEKKIRVVYGYNFAKNKRDNLVKLEHNAVKLTVCNCQTNIDCNDP